MSHGQLSAQQLIPWRHLSEVGTRVEGYADMHATGFLCLCAMQPILYPNDGAAGDLLKERCRWGTNAQQWHIYTWRRKVAELRGFDAEVGQRWEGKAGTLRPWCPQRAQAQWLCWK